jgi:single-stranded-DNA-specific exonuclease
MKKENLAQFTQRFEEVVSASITDEMLVPEITIDLEMDFNDINFKTYRILQQMAPFGPSNNRPVLMLKGVMDNGRGRLIGNDQSHLKLGVTDEEKTKTFDAIGFGMANHFSKIKNKEPFDICFVLEENEWNGNTNLQLRLKDIK